MKTTRFFAVSVFAATLLLATPQAYAQKVVDTKVTRLSDTVTMYTLTYEFGFLNADLWMPLFASRKATSGAVGYQSAATNSSALVLSDAAITKQNMYYVPKGERATFKLMVLEEQVGPETREVKRVQVTNLPHIIQREGEKQVERQLTADELEKFIVWNN
jgi:hypothetical protein